jgi:hypothetical protein
VLFGQGVHGIIVLGRDNTRRTLINIATVESPAPDAHKSILTKSEGLVQNLKAGSIICCKRCFDFQSLAAIYFYSIFLGVSENFTKSLQDNLRSTEPGNS